MKVLIKWVSGRESVISHLREENPVVQFIKHRIAMDNVQRFSLNGESPIYILNFEHAEEITLLEEE